VLYEWNCPNPHGRISLFELLSQKTELAAANLHLGKFDRLEAYDGNSRFVARLQPENAMMAVTRLVPSVESTGGEP
jgi:hypothetical protein